MAEYGPIMMSSIISQKANYLSEFGEGDVQIQELVKKCPNMPIQFDLLQPAGQKKTRLRLRVGDWRPLPRKKKPRWTSFIKPDDEEIEGMFDNSIHKTSHIAHFGASIFK